MLQEGRLPLLSAESDAVDALIAANPNVTVSLTRRDPGDSGPMLAQIGAETWLIEDDGTTTKVEE